MARPPARSPEDKERIVLAILREELTITEAARREGVSATSLAKWRDQFLEAGRAGLMAPARGPSSREAQLEAEIEQLNAALGEAHMELRVWKRGGPRAMSFTALDAERRSVGMSVTGFCERFGIPTSTWYRWRQSGSAGKGPWPRPVGDAIETAAKDKATQFDAWGHRKLAELLRIEDGLSVSDSTVYRVLDRLGLCLPANYTGEVRQLAQVRKETFIEPPVRRNRLWQADFSEFETNAGGTWNLGGVVDYWAKVNLACTVSLTKTSPDAITMLETALDHVEELLGVTWVEDLTDPDTGEIGKLRMGPPTASLPRCTAACATSQA